MTEADWAALQRRRRAMAISEAADVLILGSPDLASEALARHLVAPGARRRTDHGARSDTYLYSMAIRLPPTCDVRKIAALTASEVEALLEIADDAPDAARALEARTELEALVHIIGTLPVRQQAILLGRTVRGHAPARDCRAVRGFRALYPAGAAGGARLLCSRV